MNKFSVLKGDFRIAIACAIIDATKADKILEWNKTTWDLLEKCLRKRIKLTEVAVDFNTTKELIFKILDKNASSPPPKANAQAVKQRYHILRALAIPLVLYTVHKTDDIGGD